MNFFMVGSFFMLFMLNAGWTSNYVIKLVGFLFFAVGTAEAEERTDAFAHLKKPAYTSSAMCALAVVCQLLLKLLSPAAMADRKSTRLNSSHSGQSRMPSSA